MQPGRLVGKGGQGAQGLLVHHQAVGEPGARSDLRVRIPSHTDKPFIKDVADRKDVPVGRPLEARQVQLLFILQELDTEATRELVVDRPVGPVLSSALITPHTEPVDVEMVLANPTLQLRNSRGKQVIRLWRINSAQNLGGSLSARKSKSQGRKRISKHGHLHLLV